MKRKTIALMFCGGGPLSGSPASWERVKRPADMARWLAHVPELNLLADIEPFFVSSDVPGETGPDDWRTIASHVRSVARRVDGVLILHGIETIHYTANALSLMLRRLPFPVVLSGSPNRVAGSRMKPVEFGARANVINAAQVTLADLSGVYVVFGNRIMRGSKVQLDIIGGALHLVSADRSLAGRIDFGITLAPERARRRSGTPPIVADNIETGVYTITTAPGSAQPLRRAVAAGASGILVRTLQDYFALGPESIGTLRAVAARGIPVIVAAPHPIRDLPNGFLPLIGVSPSMAVVKAMWAIGNAKNRASLKKLLAQDIAGEVMTPGSQP